MCCEQLVCAACAGPVVDARCGVCRAGRAQVHYATAPLASQWLAAVTLLLVAFAVLAALSA